MTQLTPVTCRKRILGPITLAFVALVLVFAQPNTAQAQWTNNGNNINNTNTGNVGIGVTSPGLTLDVRGNATVFNSDSRAVIGSYDLTAMAQGVGGGIQFGGKYHSNGTLAGFASISGIKENAADNDYSSALVFTTRVMNLAQAERVRITSTGRVGIGTNAPGYLLDVQGNAQWLARFKKTDATNGGIMIDSAAGYNPALAMAVNGTIKWYMSSNNTNSDTLQFWEATGAFPRVTLAQNGNFGIGVAAPAGRIDVRQVSNGGTLATLLTSYGANEDTYLRGGSSSAVLHIGDLSSTTAKILLAEAGGNVGIGATNPTEKLEVAGNLKLTGTGNIDASGTITGATINAKYQDVAEWVESSQALPAGTVVVLDHTRSNHVVASSRAYDTRIAGVISAQPGITLGEKTESKVLVATTGRVKVKVDATAGPIQVGDLLVTSDVAGLAKKSEPLSLGGVQIHRPGTLIGKALEPLAKGAGEILVLLSLQ